MTAAEHVAGQLDLDGRPVPPTEVAAPDPTRITFEVEGANDTLTARFWAKVDKTDTCWLWTGAVGQRDRYGRIALGGRGAPIVLAHRASYEMAHGPIPVGLQIDHLCRVRSCVRPDHLEAVPQRENIRRQLQVHQEHDPDTHCRAGHEWAALNTYIDGRGRRCCRSCRRDTARRLRDTKEGRMKEKDLLAAVRQIAQLRGWLCYHTHDSRRSEPGFPDLVLSHPRTGELLFVELKSRVGKATAPQQEWLAALGRGGHRAVVWRPADLIDGTIARALQPSDVGAVAR